jgi:hypothetical protein
MANQIPEWMRDCVNVVGDDLMRSIVNDFRRGPPPPGPTLPKVTVQGAGTVVTGTDGAKHTPHQEQGGWVKPPQVDAWKPPGLEHMDRLMDQADALDKAERIRKLAEVAAVKRVKAELLKEHEEPKPSEKK